MDREDMDIICPVPGAASGGSSQKMNVRLTALEMGDGP